VGSSELTVEDREVEFIGVDALEEFVLDEMSLLAHPERLAETDGSRGSRIDSGDHPADTHLAKGEMENGMGGLGGETFASKRWIEDPTDLAVAVVKAGDLQADITDECSRGDLFNADQDAIAIVFEGLVSPSCDEAFSDLSPGHRLEGDEEADRGEQAIRIKRLLVLGSQTAKAQPVGREWSDLFKVHGSSLELVGRSRLDLQDLCRLWMARGSCSRYWL